MLRKVIGGMVAFAGIGVALFVIYFAWAATAEYTECYGVFPSEHAAEGAAEAGRNEGLDTAAEGAEDPSGSGRRVIFETGETGGDAAPARADFREILRDHGGRRGHPGNGCVERTHFD